MKKLISILLSLALFLCIPPAGVFAGEVSAELDFTNQTSDTSGDGYSWNEETKTLTLNNFSQTIPNTTDSVRAIKLPEDTTLILEGESTINNSSFGGVCIEYTGNLKIQGNGTLNLNLNMPTTKNTSSTCGKGIYEKSDSKTDNILTIDSGTLNITGNANDTGSEGYVGISGAEVHLNGGTVNIENVTYGINAYYWWVTARKIFINGGTFNYSKSKDCQGKLSYAISSGKEHGEVAITSGSVDISGSKDAMSVASSPVSVTGGSLKIHDLVRQTASSGVLQNTHAFLWGSGSRTEPGPTVSLTGGSVDISGCDYILSAVNTLGMDMLQVKDGINLTGVVRVDKYGIYSGQENLGISQVHIYGNYTLPDSLSFHEGNSGFWDISLAEGSILTIPDGKIFDLSKLSRTGEDFEIDGPGDTYDLSKGLIINNGSLYLPNEPVTSRENVYRLNVSGNGEILVKDRQTSNTIATLYRVTYQDGSDTLKTGVSYIDGTAFDYTPSEKEGFAFDGWYKEENLTTKWDFESDKVSSDITLHTKWNEVPVSIVSLNKTSLNLTISDSEQLTATITPSNAYDKSITWTSSDPTVASVNENGVVTAVSAGSAVITVTTADGNKTASCTVTVISSEGNNGGSGGGGTTGTPTVIVPVSGEQNTINVSASVSGSTATISKIDTVQIDHVAGNGKNTGMVEIDFTALNKTIDTVKLPADAVKDISAKAQKEEIEGLTIKLTNSEISFDANALYAVQSQSDSQVTLTIMPVRTDVLNDRQKKAVNGAPVYDITLKSGSSFISDFNGGSVTVSLPYTLTAGQEPAGVVVCFLDDSGNITPCMTLYDTDRKRAVFTAAHLSLYFVSYDPSKIWINPYSDVTENAWYYEAARYVSESGLMTGYGSGLFGPNNNITRAQFAQIIYNKESKPAITGESAFADVVPGAWYAPAIIWASENGIVKGYGSGNFGPDNNITREQLSVMLWRYTGSPATADNKLNFNDSDKISAYAVKALQWAVEQSIVEGKDNGNIDPKSNASRAETAVMLMRFFSK
ncbi:MAG: carbohydrate-binding domain-containing protein [Firmicutes bacterium]|nr:carbohydrate-binding domain-containing protein [Bacillota bacterium]